MKSPAFNSDSVLVLQSILEYVTGCSLLSIEVNPDGSQIRLDWQMLLATEMPLFSNILRLVITGDLDLFYLSYTETTINRKPVKEPHSIISKNLILQGASLTNSQTLVLYTNSVDKVEAGELHLSFTNYQLYDQHYGRLQATALLAILQDLKNKK